LFFIKCFSCVFACVSNAYFKCFSCVSYIRYTCCHLSHMWQPLGPRVWRKAAQHRGAAGNFGPCLVRPNRQVPILHSARFRTVAFRLYL
jgi:hypothetical protein